MPPPPVGRTDPAGQPWTELAACAAAVTGWVLVKRMLPDCPARPPVRPTDAVLSGGTTRVSAPIGAKAPSIPSTSTPTSARVGPGLATTSSRAPAPSGTPGMIMAAVGDTELDCQSAPCGCVPALRRSRAIADTRPSPARTETVSGPSTSTNDCSETVREVRPSMINPGLPGTTTMPLRP